MQATLSLLLLALSTRHVHAIPVNDLATGPDPSQVFSASLSNTTESAGGAIALATEPDPSQAFSVSLGGKTYINKGLVGFGLIPSNATESTGDTIGGIGSAIALRSFTPATNRSFQGTLVVQPDRGFNVDGTVNYQGRQLILDFTFTPYYGLAPLSFTAAQKTLQLTYRSTLLYTERGGVATTGLDALGVRQAQPGFPTTELADPPLPIPNSTFNHLSLDLEGLVLNTDGSFWVSDEYGPYIYRFDASGKLVQSIEPPQAIVPLDDDGNLDFTSDDDPDTGRAGNQGFEGLTVSADGKTLYALLQSATIQDGGNKKSNARNTRLVAFDISNAATTRPPLVGEWVVPLPLDSDSKTLGASELHWVSSGVFLVLSRDSNGHAGDDTESEYKQADLISLAGATDIHGTSFDDPSNPIAKKGKLDSKITPATYVGFVSYINSTQLARFGLHNGDPADQTLLDAKWESLALASANDPTAPDDYFLFTASDNDFISTHGISLGVPFNAGLDNDNQFFVFRVTLPGAQIGDLA
ncbi:esterase-like activity of phytase-domain-containing protein [Gloeopeniophorella convolvens]|nr:esterase-like activity of phytase-domain-containing protein [Gloeopeniophorella convolvens]